MILLLESTKSHAWRACLLACFACSRARHAYVINVLVLTCIGAYVLGVLAMLTCFCAYVLGVLACFRVCVLGTLTCLASLRAYVHDVFACVHPCLL